MKTRLLVGMMLLLSVAVIVLAAIQLLGIWENAIYVYEPMIGAVLLLQSIQNWKQNRTIAIFTLCAAIFIFCVWIAIVCLR